MKIILNFRDTGFSRKSGYKLTLLFLIVVTVLIFSGSSYAVEVISTGISGTDGNTPHIYDSDTGFRKCAENDNLSLLVDYNNGILALENKHTGYIWYSSPVDAEDDSTASAIIQNELLSSNVLRYGIPKKRNNNNYLRSHTGDCNMTVMDIDNGVRIIYDYSAGFKFPVDYVLEPDNLTASLHTAEIQETDSLNMATEVTIMGSFGAGSCNDDGYFVIPDGSGALVRFNSNRTSDTNAYSQSVYGQNITAVPVYKSDDTEQLYLSMYGIVRDDNAMLVVASDGDSDAYITAKISGQSNSNYNLCRFTFILRNTDTFYMSGNSNDKFTVFEQGNIDCGDIEVKYYPVFKEEADYIDIAGCYRNYLIERKGLTPKKDDSAFCINLYGGADKKKSVLGIPVTVKQAVTDYSQALEILSGLEQNGIENMAVSYKNWTDNGIENKIDTDSVPSSVLGGKTAFNNLLNFIDGHNISFYPSADNIEYLSGNGYNSFNSTCIRVSGAYSRIVSYDLAFGIQDGFSRNMSLLSPAYFDEVFSNTAESFISCGFSGIYTEMLTTSLYGDYGRNKISRSDAMNLTEDILPEISEKLDIMADCANTYALPYVSRIKNIPLESSHFDIFSEDVPFIEIVLHGLIPYASEAINGSPDYADMLLKAVSVGCLPCYDLIYENADILKDTELNIYYYANYRGWIDEISEAYRLLEPVYIDIAGSTITDYYVSDNTAVTSYSNGTVVKTDFSSESIDFNGSIINLYKEKQHEEDSLQ